MRRLAIALSLSIIALGAVGFVSPAAMLEVGRHFGSSGGLLLAAALRVVFGGLLIAAAPGSHAPRTLRVVGSMIVVAGLATLFFGVERARAVLEWWSSQGALFVRVWAGLAIVLGCGFLRLLWPPSG